MNNQIKDRKRTNSNIETSSSSSPSSKKSNIPPLSGLSNVGHENDVMITLRREGENSPTMIRNQYEKPAFNRTASIIALGERLEQMKLRVGDRTDLPTLRLNARKAPSQIDKRIELFKKNSSNYVDVHSIEVEIQQKTKLPSSSSYSSSLSLSSSPPSSPSFHSSSIKRASSSAILNHSRHDDDDDDNEEGNNNIIIINHNHNSTPSLSLYIHHRIC